MVVAKRVFDVSVAGLLLIGASPLMLCIGLAILLTMGRPVIFRQSRIGQGGRLFTILKFRSMTKVVDPDGNPLDDQQRTTRLGQLLRTTSCDELPQLWNVLRGDMSLSGPRPLIPEYADLCSKSQGRRHDVKPGITGWAQVNGRNALSYDERFNLDIWYVAHWSLWLDLCILVRTARVVARREGI